MSCDQETQPLRRKHEAENVSDNESRNSMSSISTASLNFEEINQQPDYSSNRGQYRDIPIKPNSNIKPFEIEDGQFAPNAPADKRARKVLYLVVTVGLIGWIAALLIFLFSTSTSGSTKSQHEPSPTAANQSNGTITLDQVLSGQWRPKTHHISWITDPGGEDGLLLERGGIGKDYLIVEDVRGKGSSAKPHKNKVLMKDATFVFNSAQVLPSDVWPSADLKNILVVSERESNWRHSFTGKYWIFNVQTQTGQPLDLQNTTARIQLASWSPMSDAIVFTRENNLFLRTIESDKTIQITVDGGPNIFYGRPDWVYEEEVLSGNSATWWSQDGRFIAFFRTDESSVPTYPIQYFLSRPSGKRARPGLENYPEVRDVKYPKAGAPNPIVHIQFYDVDKDEVFSVNVKGDFPDEDRLITEVIWAGNSGKVLIRETNRVSDKLKILLIDVRRRSGSVVRSVDVDAIDGGWFEISEETTYIPSDPGNNRPHEGYIDTVIHKGYDHLAYFSPLDNPNPALLTSGKWEVVKAPSAVDLMENRVFFKATKAGSTQRHIYQVDLDGNNLRPITDTSVDGYYDASFSAGNSYALLTYHGPGIPWQKVIGTRDGVKDFEWILEENHNLRDLAKHFAIAEKVYSTVNIDGYDLNVVEHRPPFFDETRKYPVLFYLYNGPNYQSVDKKFTVDFQSYIASSLGYIVLTLDGRGTGFLGRPTRVIVRDNIGHYEAHDQIRTAKLWAKKSYVDESRIAIWGWSYGGFMALKVLEQDAGETFHYGMAVAPVTDWRFYGMPSIFTVYPLPLTITDSIYAERYMHTPQENVDGYNNASISRVEALRQNVRFLVMHGVADDNVHMQNTLTLLDKLDLAGIENYDVHLFPDSDHSIYFHNANRIVYESKFSPQF